MSPMLTAETVEKVLSIAAAMGVEHPDAREVIQEFDSQFIDDFTTLASDKFDGGIIEVMIGRGEEGDYEAGIQFAGGGTMTAAEYREAADQYEAFPAWLRAWADRLDDITGVSS